MSALTLRNVEIDGRTGLDVRIEEGVVTEIGRGLAHASHELDGQGGALIPGLTDHHIHLLGLAAQADSVVLDAGRAGVASALRQAVSARPAGAWVRAVGYHEGTGEVLSRDELDVIAPHHPVRVQHQTGSLWILNSLALEQVLADGAPPSVETDARGWPTGRIWRGDAWLGDRTRTSPPPLAPVGRMLAAYGITAVTDASATNSPESAAILARAWLDGDLPQRLVLMSNGPLNAPTDGAFAVGPVKILLDDHQLPDIDGFIAEIARARLWGRAVAVHCVTGAEFALTLAAFEAAGSRPGDRVEHGGVIPADAISSLLDLKLTVVTQPGFIFERGDRYLAQTPAVEQDDLYRCASLIAAGVPVAGSSDAPYAAPDPWMAIRAAVQRRTRLGAAVGESERVDPARALDLFLGRQGDPGGAVRRVAVGVAADLCLLDAPLGEVLDQPGAEHVRATLIAGRLVHGG